MKILTENCSINPVKSYTHLPEGGSGGLSCNLFLYSESVLISFFFNVDEAIGALEVGEILPDGS